MCMSSFQKLLQQLHILARLNQQVDRPTFARSTISCTVTSSYPFSTIKSNNAVSSDVRVRCTRRSPVFAAITNLQLLANSRLCVS
jgi:hypothetical protein